MAIIDQREDVFTLVNVFTVTPEKQDTLVQLLIEATNKTMRHLPGFVSASIHRSLDNTRVVNCLRYSGSEKLYKTFPAVSARY